jgi:hypothetical protein
MLYRAMKLKSMGAEGDLPVDGAVRIGGFSLSQEPVRRSSRKGATGKRHEFRNSGD